MIYIATMAYREAYRASSIKLLESIRQFVPEAVTVIVTDDVSFYDDHAGLDLRVSEGPVCNYAPYFKANLKAYALNAALDWANPGDIVIFLDADCYITKPLNESMFESIGYGLSLPMGVDMDNLVTPMEVQNTVVRHKILGLNPDLEQKYHVFREAFLLFRVDVTFHTFVHEWCSIYEESLVKQLDNASVTFDIQCAMHRSGLPLNDIPKEMPFSDAFYTVTISGGISQMM